MGRGIGVRWELRNESFDQRNRLESWKTDVMLGVFKVGLGNGGTGSL